MDLVPVRTTKRDKLPWSHNSIYKWHSEGRYPDIIIKIGGKLFIDMDAFKAKAAKVRDAQVKKAEKMRRSLAA